MKVAIIHYWLVGMRGGEKVVEALCDMFPTADVYTHVYRPERISESIRRHSVKTTFIARLPFSRRHYQKYLPLMPLALEQLDLQDYDLVISSESGPAKGVITRPDALHVCYCHTPMRYVWSGYHSYRGRSNPLTKAVMPALMHRLRMWDLASAARVDHFIANSHNVAERIKKYYRRDASVIYPPVEMQGVDLHRRTEDFYLFVGQLVPYKGADVAIAAFNRMGKRLVVIGHGEDYQRLRKMSGPTVELVGWQDAATLQDYYARCKALVFVADEDFGMVPVEAMSAGRPVIAYGRGGALETVLPGKTGVLFESQTVDSLISAVDHFESVADTFDRTRIAAHAAAFSKTVFNAQMAETLGRWLDEHGRAQRRALPPLESVADKVAAAAA
ncbi:MAG TPA: glycosyltransferase [Stellaceae bacterium]|jgi:glycosyltransferase involved in cell wall biosynthesis|nr:glycosyltransferase [Stellaceae bacterium]